jgi:hypothetical protein
VDDRVPGPSRSIVINALLRRYLPIDVDVAAALVERLALAGGRGLTAVRRAGW